MFRRHDRPAALFDPRRPAAETARTVRALDLGHRLRNTIGSVRWILGDDVLIVDAAAVADERSDAPAGRLVALDERGARIATGDGDLLVTAISTAEGAPADLADVLARHGISVGGDVPPPDGDLVSATTELEPVLARDERFWLDRLAAHPLTSPVAGTGTSAPP